MHHQSNFERIHNDFWRKNISLSKKGKKRSDQSKTKQSIVMTGRKASKKTRLLMSLASKGKIKSKQHKINISIGKKGIKPKNELEWRKNLSISHIGQHGYWKGKHLPESVKQKIRQARMKQIIPKKDTKPEKIIQFNLSVRDIPYQKHVSLIGQPDIFIKPNWCIFIDGDYWHSIQKVRRRDTYINKELKKTGYKVIRIPEHTIKKFPNLVTESLIGIIYLTE